ncbi:MAG: peptidoglycan-associated lipoprotein Pal [Betaproteobacteria bacterium]|nr:MAG: peptidoglycan-associated lipoprotein Pal [Betaproteobacteria bacterium]
MRRILVSAVIVGVLAGCAGKDVKDEAPVEERRPDAVTAPPVTAPQQKPKPPVVTQVESKPLGANPLKDPNNILSKRSVLFDYDSAAVKDEFKPIVTAHAKYLTDNRGRKVVVQGNTDERGSREYNLALGQRRAESVKKMMMLLGATDGQIETVSFGEEKPRAMGSEESAWSQNRRADIVYDGE